MAEGLHVRYPMLSQSRSVLTCDLWQRSDYRGLKKHISAIRRWQEGLQSPPPTANNSRTEEKHKSHASWSAHDQYGPKSPNRRRLSIIRSRPNSLQEPIPLYAILLTLPPIHLAFFTHLDCQLEKVDSFYSEREREAQARSRALQNQLRELKDHRKIFYVSGLTLSSGHLFWFCIHPKGSVSGHWPLLVSDSEDQFSIPAWIAGGQSKPHTCNGTNAETAHCITNDRSRAIQREQQKHRSNRARTWPKWKSQYWLRRLYHGSNSHEELWGIEFCLHYTLESGGVPICEKETEEGFVRTLSVSSEAIAPIENFER